MVAAGGGDENAAGVQKAQAPQIDFFVSLEGGLELGSGFDEGGWIQIDEIETFLPLIGLLQKIEGVGFFNLHNLDIIEPQVRLEIQAGGGALFDGNHLFGSPSCQVAGEPALIGKDVQNSFLTLGELGGLEAIVPLI